MKVYLITLVLFLTGAICGIDTSSIFSELLFINRDIIAQGTPAGLAEQVNKIWPIPQIDNTIRWMTQGQAAIQAMLTDLFAVASPRKFEKVRFFLYTQSNPTTPYEIDINDVDSLSRSPFNKNNPTRFFVHGWNGGYLAKQNRKIRESLLLNGENNQFNFFAVDWSVYGETANYISAQSSCSKAGKILAEFIDWMNSAGKLSFDTLALYGHSLGAHVVGFAGKNVKLGQIDTIVGLDPAMPLFNYDNPDTRLSDFDGKYVESIHTNGGVKGFYNPIGQAAFYPNGGKSQPGCGLDLDGTCAHERAVDYLAEALARNSRNGFGSVRCSQFSEVKDESCKLYAGGVRMGDPDNSHAARGVYFLKTNNDSPFGVGS